MKKQEVKDFYIQCDCGSEHVFISPQDFDSLEEGLFLAILTTQYTTNTSFWQRLRYIWHILKYGTPYVDQVCLDLDKVKALSKYLSDYISTTNYYKNNKK